MAPSTTDTTKGHFMDNASIQLNTDQANRITELLLEAKRLLADAASPSPDFKDNYVRTAVSIGDLLRELGVDTR